MPIYVQAGTGAPFACVSVDDGVTPSRHAHSWGNSASAFGFDHQVTAPYDIATGHTSGKRQHEPVTLGPTGQRLHKPVILVMQRSVWQASGLTPGRVFPSLQVDVPGPAGQSKTIKYLQVSVVSAKHSAQQGTHELEEIHFTFQKIQWSVNGGKTFQDDWTT
jgi:hypothetical protein